MTEQEFQIRLQEKGIQLTPRQLEQFRQYYETLVEWNQKMNLTNITALDEIYEKHFYDSILPSFDIQFAGSLCD